MFVRKGTAPSHYVHAGNFRTTDNGGPYNLSLLTTQEAEIQSEQHGGCVDGLSQRPITFQRRALQLLYAERLFDDVQVASQPSRTTQMLTLSTSSPM